MRLPAALALLAVLAPQAPPAVAASAEDVAAAERAFAADAAQRGWVAAFKAHAAPDGIVLAPGPVNAHESLAARPDTPADTALKWWPAWAGIAQSGDLEFTTGPYVYGEGKSYGHYFTVWQRQADGGWRWIFDGGPANDGPAANGPEMEPSYLPASADPTTSAEQAWDAVAAVEAALALAAGSDAPAAYLAHLAGDARVMGSRAQPATDPAAHAAELNRRARALTLSPLGGTASSAGDLVFTYGEARWAEGRGHYARIWQKRSGGWALVFDELLATPP